MTKDGTLVLGASAKPYRYANRAINMLMDRELKVLALGKTPASVKDTQIHTDIEAIPAEEVDTVTIYLNPLHQQAYQDWVIKLKPRRVIFNPGAENMAFAKKLQEAGIETIFACTLVMLSTGQF